MYKASKITRVHALQSSIMRKVVSCSFKRVWTSNELKAADAEVSEFINQVVDWLSSVCASGVYKMMFYFLDH